MTQKLILGDRPIKSADEDLFGVGAFVHRLVPVLLSPGHDESLVLGLYGRWGEGKSSILNLLNQALYKHEGIPRPIVIPFTPWLYADTDTLLASFFRTLAAGLGKGDWLSAQEGQFLKESLEVMGDFAAPAIKLLPIPGVIGDVIGAGIKGARRAAGKNEAELAASKERAIKLLRAIGQRDIPGRVIVLIDDLDRCDAAEARALLKVVKLVADLPNVSYVLAMANEKVASVLELGHEPGFGAEFLEKIVQVPVFVPSIEQSRLLELTKVGIAEILTAAGIDATQALDPPGFRSGMPWLVVFSLYIRSLRDRVRYLNVLSFTLRAGPRLEVWPRDLLLLTLLQVFSPKVYESVRRARRFLTETPSILDEDFVWDVGDDLRSRVEAKRKEDFQRLSSYEEDLGRRQASARVLDLLFPFAALGKRPDAQEALRLRLENRIQAPERFDRYFILRQPLGELSDVEVETILQAMSDFGSGVDRAHGEAPDVHTLPELGFEKLLDRVMVQPADNLTGIANSALKLPGPEVARERVIRLLGATFDSAIASSNRQGGGDRSVLLGLLFNAVEKLPDSREAVEVCARWSGKYGAGAGLSASQRQELAEAGLPRAEAILAGRETPFQRWPQREAVEILWSYSHLVQNSGRDLGSVRRLTRQWITWDPGSLPGVLSLAAAWGDGGPALRIDRSPEDVLHSLDAWCGLDAIDEVLPVAEEALARNPAIDPAGLLQDYKLLRERSTGARTSAEHSPVDSAGPDLDALNAGQDDDTR